MNGVVQALPRAEALVKPGDWGPPMSACKVGERTIAVHGQDRFPRFSHRHREVCKYSGLAVIRTCAGNHDRADWRIEPRDSRLVRSVRYASAAAERQGRSRSRADGYLRSVPWLQITASGRAPLSCDRARLGVPWLPCDSVGGAGIDASVARFNRRVTSAADLIVSFT